MACSWVGCFSNGYCKGRIQIKGILNYKRTKDYPQKYIAVFNSQSNWEALWKINFYNG